MGNGGLRPDNMKCGYCTYYDEADDDSGLCRRGRPTTIRNQGNWEESQKRQWPTVAVTDWCGEFQAKHGVRKTGEPRPSWR